MNRINSDWKVLLDRRLRAEACELDCNRISVEGIRKLNTRPAKMYAVVDVDGVKYAIIGTCENTMASCLRS